MADPRISNMRPADLAIIQSAKADAAKASLRREVAETKFASWAEQGFDGVRMNRFKTLKEQQESRGVKGIAKDEELSDEEGPSIEKTAHIEDTATKFEQRNPELRMKTLLILRNRIHADDSAEEILQKVLDTYSDAFLADEALDFLLETTTGSLKAKVQDAKDSFNKDYEREIKSGRNIASESREFSEQGLGSPTALRDTYRDLTGNPRDPHTLFNELFSTYSYEKMKTAIDFFLHSLGADLKAKGPSISRAELTKLVADARTLQAILGVYRFFKERMPAISNQFNSYGITVPGRMTFELLAKQFMALVNERYLSPDKVRQLGRLLGISDELAAQLIVFTQMRDGIRQVAPKLYRNNRHRQSALNAILEALEELEEEYSEKDEDEEEE